MPRSVYEINAGEGADDGRFPDSETGWLLVDGALGMSGPLTNTSGEAILSDMQETRIGDRRVGGHVGVLISVIALSFTLFHLYTSGFGNFPNLIQRSIHVCFALVLTFMVFSARKGGGKHISAFDWVLIALSVASTVWVYVSYDRFMTRQALQAPDIILGGVMILLVMEAARRLIGLVFTFLAAAALAYAIAGRSIPMPFTHRGFGYEVIINHLYTTDLGLWGTTTAVSATVVAIFIIFGSILFFAGGGAVFMNTALIVAGRSVGGPAKVATIASCMFGSISGSAAANVAVTGSFSIPMMKRLKYDRNFAAGVEATASTGGQLMPPIMGAAAFIMAELLAVPYIEVMRAALIPALLMYGGLFLAVHFGSKRLGYARLRNEDIPDWRVALAPRKVIPLVGPITVLLYFLFSGYTPQRAGFAATITAIVLYLLQDLDITAGRERVRQLVKALEAAGYALILIAVLAATAQIVIGIIGLTGVGVRFTSILIAASGGNLVFALFIAMGVALVLGMGMPTTGAYLLAASVLAPALVRIGIEPIQAHLFVFYFAIISAITPPVCAAVFVSSGIAQSDWLKSSVAAMQLGATAFLIPYMFVYSPALLLQGNFLTVAIAVGSAAVGVMSLAAGVMGQFVTRSRIYETVMLIAAALMLIKPGSWTDLAGFAILALVWVLQSARARRQPRPVTGDV